MSSSPVQETKGAYADTDAFVGRIFALSGKFSESHAAISSLIRRNAGDVKASVTKAVTHLVSTVDDFGSRSTKVEKAMANGIPIVTERWVRESIEANEALPLRPEYVIHAGNQPLAESEESTKAKASPRTASIDEPRKADQETPTAAEDTAATTAPITETGSVRIDESHLPSALLTQAKDASLPILHPTIGEMHPVPPPAAAVAPTAPAADAAAPISTVVPPPVEELPTAVQPPAQTTTTPPAPIEAPPSPIASPEGPGTLAVATPAEAEAEAEAETQRIEKTAAAIIPPLPSPSHETLVLAAKANEPMEEEESTKEAGEKRKIEETRAALDMPPQMEEPPAKRQKLDEGAAEMVTEPPSAETDTASLPREDSAVPLEREPPAESGEGTAAVLPPSQAIPLAAAPPPAMEITPSGAETGGPTSMKETQAVYDIKVLQRKEHSPSSAHELSGLIEKQLLEGINVHNDSTTGFGSMADVFTRGVDGGAVLVESVRDYAGKDYFTFISYARQGKEFGSVHRNDEILSCGLLRDGKLSSVRVEDQPIMERLMHVHQPIVPISGNASS